MPLLPEAVAVDVDLAISSTAHALGAQTCTTSAPTLETELSHVSVVKGENGEAGQLEKRSKSGDFL